MLFRSLASACAALGSIVLTTSCASSDPVAPVAPVVETAAQPPIVPTTNWNWTRAFIWSRETGTQLIPVPDYVAEVHAGDINDAGQVAGFVTLRKENNTTHAFTWSAKSGFIDLQILLGPGGNSLAGKVDDSGAVYGKSDGPLSATNGPMGSTYEYAFVWTAQSGMKLLGRVADLLGSAAQTREGTRFWTATGVRTLTFPPGMTCSAPIDINERGQILGRAGSAKDCFEYYSPFIWDTDGTPHMIENCFASRFCSTSVEAMNNRAEVTGYRGGAPFRWTKTGGFVQVPIDGGSGRVINDSGDIAGEIYNAMDKSSKPFVWTASGEIIMLQMPERTKDAYPTGINGKGQVVGNFL